MTVPASIDLIVPFYGRPDLLRDLVASVRAQTSPDWRLLVVDDHWPGDSVGPWLEGLADPRVHYLRNPENLGVNRNFSRCLELAEAPYVAFPGGDDLLLPDYVAVVTAAAADGPTIIQPGVTVIGADGAPVRPIGDRVKARLRLPEGSHDGERLAVSLLRGNWAYFPSLAWRTEAARERQFPPGLDVVLDLALLLDLIEAGGRLAVRDEECFAYRRHAASVSSLASLDVSRFAEERAFFAAAAGRYRERGWHRAERAARHHLTSRLNAITQLPAAFRTAQWSSLVPLLRHTVTRTTR